MTNKKSTFVAQKIILHSVQKEHAGTRYSFEDQTESTKLK